MLARFFDSPESQMKKWISSLIFAKGLEFETDPLKFVEQGFGKSVVE
jgi:hypothetical protein